jgi:hypothetical protein
MPRLMVMALFKACWELLVQNENAIDHDARPVSPDRR